MRVHYSPDSPRASLPRFLRMLVDPAILGSNEVGYLRRDASSKRSPTGGQTKRRRSEEKTPILGYCLKAV